MKIEFENEDEFNKFIDDVFPCMTHEIRDKNKIIFSIYSQRAKYHNYIKQSELEKAEKEYDKDPLSTPNIAKYIVELKREIES